MADEKNNEKPETVNKDKQKSSKALFDDFLPLEELVYAPLDALIQSNERLHAQIVETIRGMGDVKQEGKKEVVHLKHVNLAYDQLSQETGDKYRIDNLRVKVPLLSIIPVSNLNIEEAEIDFSAEIRSVQDEKTRKSEIMARICSPLQKEGDFLPKVSYKIKVKTLSATEGLMRITDTLSSRQVAKEKESKSVTSSGELASEGQQKIFAETRKLKGKISSLKVLYNKISDMMKEQEKLKEIYPQLKRERDAETEQYLKIQSDILVQICGYQKQIVDMEIEDELYNKYE